MLAVGRPPDCRSNVVFHGVSRCTGEEKECVTVTKALADVHRRWSQSFLIAGFVVHVPEWSELFFLALEGCNRKNFQRSTFHERLKFLLFD